MKKSEQDNLQENTVNADLQVDAVEEQSLNEEDETEKLKKIVDKVNLFGQMFGNVWPALVVLVSATFCFFEYVWIWGKYSFWNISVEYIQLKMNELLIYFIAIFAMIIVLSAFSYLFSYYLIIYKAKSKFKNIIKGICVFLIVYAICLLIYLFVLCKLPPYYKLNTFMVEDWLLIFKWSSVISVIAYIFAFIIGLGLHVSEKSENEFDVLKQINTNNVQQQNVGEKNREKLGNDKLKEKEKKKIVRVCQSWGILLIIIPIFFLATEFYNDGYNKSAENSEVEIVEVDNKEYIIVGIYDDKWILKECKMDDETLRIKNDSYTFLEISNYMITKYSLGGDTSIKDCMVDEL